MIYKVTGDLGQSRFWWSGVGGEGQTLTGGSLRERGNRELEIGNTDIFCFCNEFTVKGSREVEW